MALNVLKKNQSGFSLIELLVAVIIFSVGLLGMMAMQTNSLISNRDANIRAQVSWLLDDMAERIQTNSAAFDVLNPIPADLSPAENPIPVDCTLTRCTPNQLAIYDIYNWYSQIQSRLPGTSATGSIARGGNSFIVTVNWNETQWNETGKNAAGTSLSITVGSGS